MAGTGPSVNVFTPSRAQSVSVNVAWTPSNGDKLFVATVDCNISINGGTAFPYPAYSMPFGINVGYTYAFDVSQTIVVM